MGEWTDRVLHSILRHFASELKWSMKMRLLSVFYFSFEISIACWLLSGPNLHIVSKLTTDVVTYRYCTETSNQKSKYAYRKIFFYKKKHWKKVGNEGPFSTSETRHRERAMYKMLSSQTHDTSCTAASVSSVKLTVPAQFGLDSTVMSHGPSPSVQDAINMTHHRHTTCHAQRRLSDHINWVADYGYNIQWRIQYNRPLTSSMTAAVLLDELVMCVISRSNWHTPPHFTAAAATTTMCRKKNCTVLFCNSFVRASSSKTIFGTHILKLIFYHPYTPYSLYNQRWEPA